MKTTKITLPACLLLGQLVMSALVFQTMAQAPAIQWQQSYGGSGIDNIRSVRLTSDGGYILGGCSLVDPSAAAHARIIKVDGNGAQQWERSFADGTGIYTLVGPLADGSFIVAGGASGVWLLKVDANGNTIWDHTFGDWDFCASVIPTRDGGFVVAASSLSGISGNKTSPNYGDWDMWIFKIDANGNKLWEEMIGGSGSDVAGGSGFDGSSCIIETGDGGFAIVGASTSPPSGNKTAPVFGCQDGWVVKLDASGSKLWDRTFGGNDGGSSFNMIQETPDGGLAVAGSSSSGINGNKTSPCYGWDDIWIVRLDADGNKLWDKSFGGNGMEYPDFFQITDGGFFVGGYTESGPSGNKTSPTFGGPCDYWVVRIDTAGNLLWERTFGGSDGDEAYFLRPTPDGGCLLFGDTFSPEDGNKTDPGFGQGDIWLIRLDGNGNKLWGEILGGTGEDRCISVQKASDGGYIIGAWSNSEISGNKTSPAFGSYDFWVVKLFPEFNTPPVAVNDGLPDDSVVPRFTWASNARGANPVDWSWGSSTAVDQEGNRYVSGSFSGTMQLGNITLIEGDWSPFLAKYDAAGQLAWAKRLGSTNAWVGASVALDAVGNVYLVSTFQGSANIDGTSLSTPPGSGNWTTFIARYAPNGTLTWVRQVEAEGLLLATGIATDPIGNSYITGLCSGTALFNGIGISSVSCFFLAKLDPSGRFVWVRQAVPTDSNDPNSGFEGSSVALDKAGNVYVTGGYSGSVIFEDTTVLNAVDDDIFIAKFDETGGFHWVRQVVGSGSEDYNNVTISPSGKILITATVIGETASFGNITLPSSSDQRLCIATMDDLGNFQAVKTVMRAGGSAYGTVTSDAVGNVYVAGWFQEYAVFDTITLAQPGSCAFFVAKYAPAGNLMWVRQGPANSIGGGLVDSAGNVHMTGRILLGGVQAFLDDIALTPSPAGVQDMMYSAKLGNTPILATTQGTPVVLNVLANDSDPDQDLLTVAAVSQGAHGVVVNNGDGIVTYSPEASFFGVDVFTYTISDGKGGSASANAAVAVKHVGNTQLGANVVVVSPGGVTLGFAAVSFGGDTVVTTTTEGPPAPQGFSLGDLPIYYEINTTATFTPPVIVRISFDPARFTDPSTVRLLHYQNNQWVDVTTSVDVLNHAVYGTVNSLSPFAIVEVSNRPPVANAGPDQVVSAGQGGQATVTLNGSASTDPDSNILTFTWTGPFGTASGATPAVTLPLGAHTITLTVSDGKGGTSSDTVAVTVRDTTGPVITGPANITVSCSTQLLVPVNFVATATDNCDPAPTLRYSQAPGSGFPVGATTVTVTATDASGNQSECAFTVTRAPLGFAGFLAPIGGADATGGSFTSPARTFKLNSTIPIKFTASCGSAPVLTGVHTLQALKWSDQTTSEPPIDATPTDAATSGNQFRLVDGQWHFNLDTKTTGLTVGKWQLIATLSDGSQHTVWIQIK